MEEHFLIFGSTSFHNLGVSEDLAPTVSAHDLQCCDMHVDLEKVPVSFMELTSLLNVYGVAILIA